MRLTQLTLCCSAILTITWACATAPAADRVAVQLADGRVLTGEVDPRTDDQRLWLRSSSPSFVMRTSIGWEKVVAAFGPAGQPLATDQMPQALQDLAVEKPADHLVERAAGQRVRLATPNQPDLITRRREPDAATRVTTVAVEARVANWDRDAEMDGVEVRLVPRNAWGEPVPVSGQLSATLIGRNQLPPHDRDAFPQLGRWSLRTDTSDFGPGGAIYRLPFRGRTHPDRDRSLQPHGLLEAQLSVFGQGRFAADTTVYLQVFNPIRSELLREAAPRDR